MNNFKYFKMNFKQFGGRSLDVNKKPLPIYFSEDMSDTMDSPLFKLAMPQMPTGMDKDEEAEHDLQQAIVRGAVIPTPEVIESIIYDRVYPEDYKMPRQLIYIQPFSMETDITDYDIDSEDEQFIISQAGKFELTPDKFEEIIERLEKGSGQTVVTLQEAKALIKEDNDLIIAIYDYWLNKRLKTQHPLIPHVRTELSLGVANQNPYNAFRQRTEKMQTRKNRKNDESSYEKMLKLKRDLTRAFLLFDMVKRREKSKRELVHLTIEVFEKRTQAEDFDGQIVLKALQQRPVRPALTLLHQRNSMNEDPILASLTRKERRQYKKRRHKISSKSSHIAATGSAASLLIHPNAPTGLTLEGEDGSSEDRIIQLDSPSEDEEEDEGVFAFRRKEDCEYLAPVDDSDSPWCSKDEIDKKHKFYSTSITSPRGDGSRYLGLCRRRVGRGGRIVLDRMHDLRQLCRSMGYDPTQSIASPNKNLSQTESVYDPGTHPENNEESIVFLKSPSSPPPDYSSSPLGCWHHFRPKTPEIPFESHDLMMAEPKLETLNEESIEDSSEEGDLRAFVDIVATSYHLGLVVSSGDWPLSYSVDSLNSDPPLYKEPLASHIDTPGNAVVLDENTSELENALS